MDDVRGRFLGLPHGTTAFDKLKGGDGGVIRGFKHDFPFINICKVPREVLKTEGEARGTLRMLMNNKIIFDRYYEGHLESS